MAKAAGNSDSLDLRPARLPSTLPKDDEGSRRKQEGEKEIHQGHEVTPFKFQCLVSAPSAKFFYMDAQDAQDYRPQPPCPDCRYPVSRFA